MGIFSRKETLAENESLKTQLTASQAKVTTLEAEAKTLEGAVKTLNESITSKDEEIKDLTESNQDLTKDLSEANEAISKHKEAVSDFDKKVDKGAIEIAAAAGADPVGDTESDEAEGSFNSRFTKAQKAGGTDLAKFMDENSSEISAQLKQQK